jgi:hypothetical protein
MIGQRQVVYSLSSPRLTSKAVPRHERKREAFGNLRLYENRRALIALVGVLLVDRSVMFLRIIAAFEHCK